MNLYTDNDLQTLAQTLHASVSPYHCILEAERQLSEAGFLPLSLGNPWTKLKRGGSYFVNVFDSTLFAFRIGKEFRETASIRIASAHTDWPCLKLKPSPEVSSERYGKLNVEVYGGPILSTWLDRPLSIAGKVCLKGNNPFSPKTVFVDFKRPLLTIPNLAIHMNRKVNDGVALNPQSDMLPVLTLITEALDRECYFINLLASELKVMAGEILDYELYIYNTEQGTQLGLANEFYSAPRLDNVTSVQAALSGLVETSRDDGLNVIALYDNEEIGSFTKQGADTAVTERILRKIYSSFGLTEFLDDALFRGFLLSMDVAHATHPNHGERNDIKNKIMLNDGVVIKMAARQSYATDARFVSVAESLCLENEIPYRKFSNRSDIPGGSTLGAIASGKLNMPAVDVGIPMLAMHSARELMGSSDQKALTDLCRAFFR
ncbi:M18 family aminopeptidase [Clostridium sp. AM58-1XD]|uniref:M18 family aminopeptidase n=1 Tax=Clostridium sp. AM58-1XD TaxID=2292307 RepID=UPI000E48D8EC|nr:M18 family aminopeptidase [Clostridium sp. AM58-1XD]RGZ00905.1 M18 family aminopeptidase [Clostridium sp. AM58-1XD]